MALLHSRTAHLVVVAVGTAVVVEEQGWVLGVMELVVVVSEVAARVCIVIAACFLESRSLSVRVCVLDSSRIGAAKRMPVRTSR